MSSYTIRNRPLNICHKVLRWKAHGSPKCETTCFVNLSSYVCKTSKNTLLVCVCVCVKKNFARTFLHVLRWDLGLVKSGGVWRLSWQRNARTTLLNCERNARDANWDVEIARLLVAQHSRRSHIYRWIVEFSRRVRKVHASSPGAGLIDMREAGKRGCIPFFLPTHIHIHNLSRLVGLTLST